MSIKIQLKIFFSALSLILWSNLALAEVGKTFTATLPDSKPGDATGSFELTLGGLSGSGTGSFTDTKTGHYKYSVTGGTGWWSTKRTSEVGTYGSFIRYGLQLNSLQILQSFNSKVQNSILNGKNNATEDAYECPSGAGGSSVDYNWIILRPRTKDEGAVLEKNYSIATKNRVGGRMHYSQSGGAVTFTGESSFNLVDLSEEITTASGGASADYAVGPQGSEVCETGSSARQVNANTGANYFDPYGYTWFGKKDATNNPQTAIYISTKSSPLVALIAPVLDLNTAGLMTGLDDYQFAALYTSWSSKTSITTKTALLTPNAQGTAFTLEEVSNLDNPTTSTSALGTITCPEANWNLPSQGFCKGTITLTGSAATGNSVCMIADIGTQKTISCIAQNPANPAYAITVVSTYSKKANITVTPSYSEGVGCKTFVVTNLSNRKIPTMGDSDSSPIQAPWYFGSHTFTNNQANLDAGYCGTSLARWSSCNVEVCNDSTAAASDVETIRVAYDDDGLPATTPPAATTNAIQAPITSDKALINPNGIANAHTTDFTCSNLLANQSTTNALKFNVQYASDNSVEDLLASPDYSALASLALSNTQGYSIVNKKFTVDCSNANVHHLDQVTIYGRYHMDGDLTTNDVSITMTIHRDDDGDGDLNPADNCPNEANADQADADADGVGDVCDICPNVSNANQADADSDGLGNACDNCPNTSNADQADTGDSSDGVGDACDNCPVTTNADQANADSDALGDACDSCPNDATNDADADSTCENTDNCPGVSNADQANADADAYGDACDNCVSVANNAQTDTDVDGDGDDCDNCVSTSNADQANADGDAQGDSCDNCPNNSNSGQENGDGDALGDACDNCTGAANDGDNDFDGICNGNDNCPNNSNADQADHDSNGGDACDGVDHADNDSDGIHNHADNCPNNSNADQNPAACADADSDGVLDASDNCPSNQNANQANSDGDSLGDACDNCTGAANDGDNDSDGICNGNDNCPNNSNADQADHDSNGGDVCDGLDHGDNDGDGLHNHADNCLNNWNPGQENVDNDSLGDSCDSCIGAANDGDNDGDSICTGNDNCPWTSNADQADHDSNGGDACDGLDHGDNDSDGVHNHADNCPNNSNADQNPAACADADNDGILDASDNCVNSQNAGQENADGDSLGDACDSCTGAANDGDSDGDSICNGNDNCPNTINADQADHDANGGDACDGLDHTDTDADGIHNHADNCPGSSNSGQEDADSDGVGNTCDSCTGAANDGDSDGDSICNGNDNCPTTSNPDQNAAYCTDGDTDGVMAISDCNDAIAGDGTTECQ